MTRKIEQVRFAESAPKKKRVAACARVSSGKDAMLHSLSAQVSYYSDYIQSNGWEYAGVYADEAITGTKDKRFHAIVDHITILENAKIQVSDNGRISTYALCKLDYIELGRMLNR